jgi:DNA polymerase-3 subunit alpha
MRRINLRTVNKRVMESLIQSGAFDCFENITRAQYFADYDGKSNFLEALLKYGNGCQRDKTESAVSLFGDMATNETVPEPKIPKTEDWGLMEKLNKEKEITGFYISGHPLDDYKVEMINFATPIERAPSIRGKDIAIGGIVTSVSHRVSKKGQGFGTMRIEDFSGTMEITLFGENYLKLQHFMKESEVLLIKGKYMPKWGDESTFEFKPVSIQQMDSVGSAMTESITLKIPITALSEDLITKIEAICDQHKGTHKLKMYVHDVVSDLALPMVAKERKVNAGNEFIKQLDKIGVNYKLN